MNDLEQWAILHLEPLGITLEQAHRDADSDDFAPEPYVTPQALSALHRLRSARSGTLTPVAAYSPAMAPTLPLTVAADPGDPTLAHFKDTSTSLVVPFGDLPKIISGLGVDFTRPTYRTLVVDTPATLHRLHQAALADRTAAASPVIDWWVQRAEHPGTHATLTATGLLPLRWAAPCPRPEAATIQQWATWTHLPDAADPATQALALVRLATICPPLPGLNVMPERDSRDYGYRARGSQKNWHRRDSRSRAAMGLTTRTQAAEMFASLRLGDPLVATAERLTGTVVTGTVTEIDTRPHRGTSAVRGARVVTRQPVCRHRAEASLSGWLGQAWDPQDFLLKATLAETRMDANGSLTLALEDAVNSGPRTLQVGDTITLRPQPVSTRMQSQETGSMFDTYADSGNWLSRRGKAPQARRAVPMDVVIAAATDD